MSVPPFTLVWIDHHQAKILQFNSSSVQRATVRSTHAHEHQRHADADGHVLLDHGFLERVAQAIMHSGAILMTGPCDTKRELMSHIERRHPELARLVFGFETVDQPSDGELLALARRFYRPQEARSAAARH